MPGSASASINSASLYHATTIKPNGNVPNGKRVHRSRLLSILNGSLNSSSLGCIIGPLGAGKTELALQWAMDKGTDVQYISARSSTAVNPNAQGQPTELGLAVAELFTAASFLNVTPNEDEIEELLHRVVDAAANSRQSIIVDDMELLGRKSANILEKLLPSILPILSLDGLLIVSRTMDSEVLASLRGFGPVRMVLPSLLAFSAAEANEARELGVFGNASANQVEAAREHSAGWIMGMLTELHGHGGHTVDRAELASALFNDSLLLQPEPIMSVMLASARVPFASESLWEIWFDELRLPRVLIPSVMSQLPIRQLGTSADDGFEIVPVVREHFNAVNQLSGNAVQILRLMELAIDWYIQNEYFELAIRLAQDQGLETHYMEAVRPYCAKAAAVEDWEFVHHALQGMAEDLISQYPNMSFWYFLSLNHQGDWSGLRMWGEQNLDRMAQSTNPIVRARFHLIRAWMDYIMQDANNSASHAEASYQLFPKEASTERMWAAGAASIASSLRGSSASARSWSALSNVEQTLNAHPSSLAHSSYSVLRYSWLAVRGLLEESVEIIHRQILALSSAKELTFRYHLLLALIEIERMNFDSARMSINDAIGLSNGAASLKHWIRMAESNLARAEGRVQDAYDLLKIPVETTQLRFDSFARETYQRADLALELGDTGSAELSLSAAPMAEIPSIRVFGDAHPQLAQAKLLWSTGDQQKALDLCDLVFNRELAAEHVQVAVAAQSLLAFMFHESNNVANRDRSIETAVRVAGDSGFQFSFVVNGLDVRQLATSPTHSQNDPVSSVLKTENRLTAREVEILDLVDKKLSNKEIASHLFVSLSTVKNHLSNIFVKLNTNSRYVAVDRARSKGWLLE